MQLLRWPGDEAPSAARSVTTLGVFDGIHRGHRQVIERVLSVARERSCSSALVTFDRHPVSVLSAVRVPCITSLDHRLHLFERMGVELCVVVGFTAEVAAMPAARFALEVFRDLLGAEVVVLGFNSRFGVGREADARVAVRLGHELGFEVISVPPVEVDGAPISSTKVCEAILRGDLTHASDLLGRPFSLYGTVVPGSSRGQALGFPTANLDLHNETIPPDGVYACWGLLDELRLPAVVSIGTRPTFHREPHPERVVEVHLMDCHEDLYGRDVEVQFAGCLREQIIFEGAGGLRAQIERDVREARRLLGAHVAGN